MSGQCAEELCMVFPGQRRALESEAKPLLDWSFPAVPAEGGQGVLGGGPLTGESLVTPGTCPTLNYSVATSP